MKLINSLIGWFHNSSPKHEPFCLVFEDYDMLGSYFWFGPQSGSFNSSSISMIGDHHMLGNFYGVKGTSQQFSVHVNSPHFCTVKSTSMELPSDPIRSQPYFLGWFGCSTFPCVAGNDLPSYYWKVSMYISQGEKKGTRKPIFSGKIHRKPPQAGLVRLAFPRSTQWHNFSPILSDTPRSL